MVVLARSTVPDTQRRTDNAVLPDRVPLRTKTISRVMGKKYVPYPEVWYRYTAPWTPIPIKSPMIKICRGRIKKIRQSVKKTI
jgi:hypothetical protein